MLTKRSNTQDKHKRSQNDIQKNQLLRINAVAQILIDRGCYEPDQFKKAKNYLYMMSSRRKEGDLIPDKSGAPFGLRYQKENVLDWLQAIGF